MRFTGFLLLRTCDLLLATCPLPHSGDMRTMFAKAQREAGSHVPSSTVVVWSKAAVVGRRGGIVL